MLMLGSEPLAVHFPVSAEVPEGTRHLRLRTLLYQFLEHAFAGVAMVGSEQFVYWDPSDPRACLAPDAFVRFGSKNEDFQSWKVWERGAPHVAVEIISESDASESSWAEKLGRYRQVGVSELVWFDPLTPEHPLRVWDIAGDDLLERPMLERWAKSRHLGGYWLPVAQANGDLTLRLSRDEHGLELFPTLAEHHEQRLRDQAFALRVAEEARSAAEKRIALLEAELKRRG